MRKSTTSIIGLCAAGVVASLALGGPGTAGAAPAAGGGAVDTIARIQSQGGHAIISKQGDDALSKCTVTRVNPVRTPQSSRMTRGSKLNRPPVFVGVEC